MPHRSPRRSLGVYEVTAQMGAGRYVRSRHRSLEAARKRVAGLGLRPLRVTLRDLRVIANPFGQLKGA